MRTRILAFLAVVVSLCTMLSLSDQVWNIGMVTASTGEDASTGKVHLKEQDAADPYNDPSGSLISRGSETESVIAAVDGGSETEPLVNSLSSNTTLPPDINRSIFFGDWCILRPFMEKVNRIRRPLHIGIIGSSFSAGSGVGRQPPFTGSKEERTTHRYSTLLEELLNGEKSQIHSQGVKVYNLARGGCATRCWLNGLHAIKAAEPALDLLIAEMIMDIAWIPQPEEFQELLIQMLALRIPFVFMTGFITHSKKRHLGPLAYHATGGHQQDFLRLAEIPYFSYRDYIWPNRTNPPRDLWTKWWQNVQNFKGNQHPGRVAHKCVAEYLHQSISEGIREFTSKQPVCNMEVFHAKRIFNRSAAEAERCLEPTTRLHSEHPDARAFQPDGWYEKKIWQYRSDSQEKYGWIGEIEREPFPEKPRISFPITVGPKRRVEITFLRTYQKIGAALVWLPKLAESQLIDGLWSQTISVPDTVTIFVGRPGRTQVTFRLIPTKGACSQKSFGKLPGFDLEENRLIKQTCTNLTARKQKFKILSIVAC